MATVIQASTNNLSTADQNVITLASSIDDPFYTKFDTTKDIISNPSKLYLLQVIPRNTPITLSVVTNSIYTGSYAGLTILSAYTAASGSVQFGSIQSLLRSYSTDMSSLWIPVSSSTFDRVANYATVLSFSNNIIGDKLSIYSTLLGRFSMSFSGSSLYAQNAYDISGITYDINPLFTQYTNNFGLLFTSSTDTTLNADNFRGLFFGLLGLVMLYHDTASYAIGNIGNNNIVKLLRLNSKTYFCRITNLKYNAATNPTWVTYSAELGANIIRNTSLNPYTCITSLGLYNDDNLLLGLAKFSYPILKYKDSLLHAKVVLLF